MGAIFVDIYQQRLNGISQRQCNDSQKIPSICFPSKSKHFDLHIKENKHVEPVCDDFLEMEYIAHNVSKLVINRVLKHFHTPNKFGALKDTQCPF